MEEKIMELRQSSLMVAVYNVFVLLKSRNNHTKHDQVYHNLLIRIKAQTQHLPVSPAKSQQSPC
jgi:hypothetical protein